MKRMATLFVLTVVANFVTSVGVSSAQVLYSYGASAEVYYPPRPMLLNPAPIAVGVPPTAYGPSRTIYNNATRGSVTEYTHNGNGYIFTPGSSYVSVVESGPSVFPSIAVVSSIEPAVEIDSRPTAAANKIASRQGNGPAKVGASEISLSLPKEATGSLTYRLNGTLYSIKPGYTQSFPADRKWIIEFLRSGQTGQMITYGLPAGEFHFVSDQIGWDLRERPVFKVAPPVLESPAIKQMSTPAPIPNPDL